MENEEKIDNGPNDAISTVLNDFASALSARLKGEAGVQSVDAVKVMVFYHDEQGVGRNRGAIYRDNAASVKYDLDLMLRVASLSLKMFDEQTANIEQYSARLRRYVEQQRNILTSLHVETEAARAVLEKLNEAVHEQIIKANTQQESSEAEEGDEEVLHRYAERPPSSVSD